MPITNKLPKRIIPIIEKTLTMNEAEHDNNGHGIFLCVCGNTIRQCRCLHNQWNPVRIYHITDWKCPQCQMKVSAPQPTVHEDIVPFTKSVIKYVRRRGNKWVVLSEAGKVLGTHDSKEDANRQLRAIEANKHKELKRDGSLYFICKDAAKIRRARGAHVLVDSRIQRYAEEHEEPDVAKKIGGVWIKGDGPVDVVIKNKYGKIKHGIEVKVVVDNNNDKITMHGSAEAHKHDWEKEHKAVFHTVVIDDSGCVAHNLNGRESRQGKTKKIADALERYLNGDKKAMDMCKRKIYYRRGFGSFRFHNMLPIKDFKALRQILDVPDDELPKAAKRKTQYKYNPNSSGERKSLVG